MNDPKMVVRAGVLLIVFANGEERAACRDLCAKEGHPYSARQAEAHLMYVDRIRAEYSAARAKRTPEQIAEERFEMRAAFGRGARVVDVITGRVTVLD